MKTLISLVAAILFFAVAANSQSKTITINGRVSSFEESLALEGVSVSVKNTNKNSGTQADGTFSIAVSGDDKTLVFSLQDYETKEISITEQKDYEVVLKRKNSTDLSVTNIDLLKNVQVILDVLK